MSVGVGPDNEKVDIKQERSRKRNQDIFERCNPQVPLLFF